MEQIPTKRSLQFVSLLLCFVFAPLVEGCKLPLSGYTNGPLGIPVLSESFIVEWDYPEDQIGTLPSSIDHFNVYYRYLDEDEWFYLASTTGPETRVTTWLSHFRGSGDYLISVEGIKNNGNATDLITSIDFDSQPLGGWYIIIQD